MKHVAAPMVGGLVSPTLFALIALPAIYRLCRGRLLRDRSAAALPETRRQKRA